MHDALKRSLGSRAWFEGFRRAHTSAALGVTAICCLVLPFLAEFSVLIPYGVAMSLTVLLLLPHTSLDQYSAFIAMQPRLGQLWPLGFVGFYGASAVAICFGWIFAPAYVLMFLVLTSALHYGLGDVEDQSRLRWLEIAARGFAPAALAVLFNADAVALFAGSLILDPLLATIAVYDYAVPAAIVWQVAWAIVVIRHLSDAVGRSSWGSALVAAEMSLLVLAFAVLPPLVAFALYVCLFHAPRHLIDFADRNPQGRPPGDAFLRVLRATATPTAMIVAGLAFMFYYIGGSGIPQSHTLRLAIWLVTAFSVPHMILTLLATRRPGGLKRVAPPVEAQGAVGSRGA
jgi:beta-carotene 15,15'-dioxygenase